MRPQTGDTDTHSCSNTVEDGPKAESGISPSTLLPKIPDISPHPPGREASGWSSQSVGLLRKALSVVLMNARVVPREAEERQRADRL